MTFWAEGVVIVSDYLIGLEQDPAAMGIPEPEYFDTISE